VEVRELRAAERDWLWATLRAAWGDDVIAVRGALRRPAEMTAVVAVDGDERIGVATWTVERAEAELMTLNAFRTGAGVGRALIGSVAAAARVAGARRLLVMTTNDNTRALRVYQRFGFRIAEVRPGAVDEARRTLKPSIAAVGLDGIPIRDEIDLVLDL
jgi:ribosomal protein S18 acetylase RimI-like enzyme